jgi:hypothetical protein
MAAFIVVLVIALYFVPSGVAFARNDPRGPVLLIANLLLGWTVAGWLILLVVATRPAARPQPVPVMVRQQYGRRRG